MKRILKGVLFALTSAAVVYVILIGLCTIFFPDLEERDVTDDYDDYIDPDLENDAWKID